MNNKNYSPINKLKSIPLPPFPSVLPNPFFAPVPFGFAEGLLLPSFLRKLRFSRSPSPFLISHLVLFSHIVAQKSI